MEEVFSEDGIELISYDDYSGFSYKYIIIPFDSKNGSWDPAAKKYYTKEHLQEMSYDELIEILYKSRL